MPIYVPVLRGQTNGSGEQSVPSGPFRTLTIGSSCCGAARHSGLSLQVQIRGSVNSHVADGTPASATWANARCDEAHSRHSGPCATGKN